MAIMDLSNLKSKFVTENQIDEKRKKRQEEWDKVRKPEDPEDAPEEVADNRCLYERLQEQKQKKDDEYQEQFQLRNLVKGLTEDDSEFLDYVSNRQEELLKERLSEDARILREYHDAMSSRIIPNDTKVPERKPTAGSSQFPVKPRPSQQSLLMRAVKRKSTDIHPVEKRLKPEHPRSAADGDENVLPTSTQSKVASEQSDIRLPPEVSSSEVSSPADGVRVTLVLPGLGAYSDSSDDNSSSDDS